VAIHKSITYEGVNSVPISSYWGNISTLSFFISPVLPIGSFPSNGVPTSITFPSLTRLRISLYLFAPSSPASIFAFKFGLKVDKSESYLSAVVANSSILGFALSLTLSTIIGTPLYSTPLSGLYT
jgi:hypothetical protein